MRSRRNSSMITIKTPRCFEFVMSNNNNNNNKLGCIFVQLLLRDFLGQIKKKLSYYVKKCEKCNYTITKKIKKIKKSKQKNAFCFFPSSKSSFGTLSTL